MSQKYNYAYFGGGCFWCIEAVFEDLSGVSEVISGYSGGCEESANYKDVCNGQTNHAEICQIKYDPTIIFYDKLVKIFFLSHDPTTLNQQGNDIGPQYRSIIFYSNQKEERICKNYISELQKKNIYNNIVTELKPFNIFYKAENYHQNYFKLNSEQPYCKIIINPKIEKLRQQFKQYYCK
tara:strand:+ start:988 stop:1527 length:540 start_codon:yes stop_codon:yes gene_type:complete